MLSRFRQPAADFRVELSETTLAPGDELNIRVSLAPRDGFQVRRGRVEILCVESYVDRVDDGRRTGRMRLTRILSRYERVFIEDIRVRRGLPRYFDIDWTAPPDAVPTAVGIDTGAGDVGITWVVRTSLDVEGARDFNDTREIAIASSPVVDDELAAPIAAEKLDDLCDISLLLPRGAARASETIEGMLSVKVLRDVNFSDVKAELIRVEAFGYVGEDRRVDTVTLDTDIELRSGETREWHFHLETGQVDAPSLRTDISSVKWLVKCVLARKMRIDTHIEQEIRVDA